MTEARKRDRSATRLELVRAARRRFAREGYDGTSVRDVAATVGVDPALVFRYFGSKRGLFDEAMAIPHEADAMLSMPLEQWPAELLRLLVFQDWAEYAGEHPLIATLRSSGEDDRSRLRDEICGAYIDAMGDLSEEGARDKQLRAELFAAWLLGMGILRSAVGTPALSKAELADIAPHLERVASAIFGRPIRATVGDGRMPED